MGPAKGTKGNPFYVLRHAFENGILRLDPYPVLNDRGEIGPRFVLKNFWPVMTEGMLSWEIPTTFLYSPNGPAGTLEFTRRDIIRLAEEAEKKQHWCRDPEFALNAYILQFPVSDDRLVISDKEERKKRGLEGRYVVIPIQFFHVDVEVPEEIRKHAEVLKILGV